MLDRAVSLTRRHPKEVGCGIVVDEVTSALAGTQGNSSSFLSQYDQRGCYIRLSTYHFGLKTRGLRRGWGAGERGLKDGDSWKGKMER